MYQYQFQVYTMASQQSSWKAEYHPASSNRGRRRFDTIWFRNKKDEVEMIVAVEDLRNILSLAQLEENNV